MSSLDFPQETTAKPHNTALTGDFAYLSDGLESVPLTDSDVITLFDFILDPAQRDRLHALLIDCEAAIGYVQEHGVRVRGGVDAVPTYGVKIGAGVIDDLAVRLRHVLSMVAGVDR